MANRHLSRSIVLQTLFELDFKGQLKNFIEPFFPRYIFIRFNHKTDDWAPIRSTRGICGLVRFAGVPKPVSTELIEALSENENNKKLQCVTEKSWKHGDKVQIEQGPFAGYQCIFQELLSC